MRVLSLSLLLLSVPAFAQTQTTDFPSGADWATVTRPPQSIISAASHTDYDEFAIPMSANVGAKFAKSLPVKGAVDYLPYSGPPSRSTLQNMEVIAKQLGEEAFKPIFTCVRTACGGYEMAMSLAMPLINAIDGTGYHNFNVETFGAVTGDVRYTAFQRGEEYIMVLTDLAPGHFSGVLLINVGGKNPVPHTPAAAAAPNDAPGATPSETTSTASAATNSAKQRIRSKLSSLLKPN